MLIKVFGAAVQGIDATLITIEVNSSRGCMFYLVGLPDSAVKESHQRIISALLVNGYKMPTSNIVVNMAPADIRKEGSAYDLPLAIGLLGANETISSEKFSRYLLMVLRTSRSLIPTLRKMSKRPRSSKPSVICL